MNSRLKHETFCLDLTEVGASPYLFIALFWPHYLILNAASLCGPAAVFLSAHNTKKAPGHSVVYNGYYLFGCNVLQFWVHALISFVRTSEWRKEVVCI